MARDRVAPYQRAPAFAAALPAGTRLAHGSVSRLFGPFSRRAAPKRGGALADTAGGGGWAAAGRRAAGLAVRARHLARGARQVPHAARRSRRSRRSTTLVACVCWGVGRRGAAARAPAGGWLAGGGLDARGTTAARWRRSSSTGSRAPTPRAAAVPACARRRSSRRHRRAARPRLRSAAQRWCCPRPPRRRRSGRARRASARDAVEDAGHRSPMPSRPAWLVVQRAWQPHWRASVDGRRPRGRRRPPSPGGAGAAGAHEVRLWVDRRPLLVPRSPQPPGCSASLAIGLRGRGPPLPALSAPVARRAQDRWPLRARLLPFRAAMSDLDAIVIGGGPAGSTVGALLARAGRACASTTASASRASTSASRCCRRASRCCAASASGSSSPPPASSASGARTSPSSPTAAATTSVSPALLGRKPPAAGLPGAPRRVRPPAVEERRASGRRGLRGRRGARRAFRRRAR